MEPDLKRLRTPVFCGVAEPLVDEVLDHLSDADRLPSRCLVLGTNMSLLGALCRQWSGQVEVVVVLLSGVDHGMRDVAEAIALREGFRLEDIIWVGEGQVLGDMHTEEFAAVVVSSGDALNMAHQIGLKLLP